MSDRYEQQRKSFIVCMAHSISFIKLFFRCCHYGFFVCSTVYFWFNEFNVFLYRRCIAYLSLSFSNTTIKWPLDWYLVFISLFVCVSFWFNFDFFLSFPYNKKKQNPSSSLNINIPLVKWFANSMISFWNTIHSFLPSSFIISL